MPASLRAGFAATLAIAAALAMPLAGQTPGKPVPLPGAYDGGYLVFQSADSAFKYWLDGRLQVDGAVYSDSKNTNSLANGTEIRRGRLGVKTTMFTNWLGEMDFDFAANAVEMKDMWIGYQGLHNTLLRVGAYKEPFSLETLTSSKYITFLERSYIDNFSPDRHIGAGVTKWDDRWRIEAGAFGQEAGQVDASGRNEGYAFTGRFTVVPVRSAKGLIHIGGALSARWPDAATGADTNTFRFRARPETDISLTRFLTTGKIRAVDHTSYYNGEFASVYGPASLQAEYTKVVVRRLGSLPNESFDGWYVSGSVFLTGESRNYVSSDAEFDRVYPRSRHGAWELAARVSHINLTDSSVTPVVAGGSAMNYTVGLNWYINANFKWMLNYVRVINDADAKPDVFLAPAVTGDKFNIFQMRFALAL
jgi:phosphate-selective porin OprO/OprP